MDNLYFSKISLVETIRPLSNMAERIYGICVEGDKFNYENRIISTNKIQVGELISRIIKNEVANVHINDVVSDFICEYDLETLGI